MFDYNKIDEIIEELSIEELVGQLFCLENKLGRPKDETERLIKKIKPGAFFVAGVDGKDIKELTELANSYTKVPIMIAADIENGPGHAIPGEVKLPYPMAWGACDDAELIQYAHEETAKICRKNGIHWTFSPIVDINFNFNNPVVNVRGISDSPKQVAKIGAAAVRGMQKNGYMAVSCKHFPGDGVDDRNQHFCTTVNSLSKEEWFDSFGYVYKKMIEAGAASIMVGHIALPFFDEKLSEWYGYPPSTMSYNVMTRLLKEELGFGGCVISDALSMVGASAAFDEDVIATQFINAGGDMLLFPLEEYYDNVLRDVHSGKISLDRIKDAVRRILKLKGDARIFEDNEKIQKEIEVNEVCLKSLGEKIAEKAIKVVRDVDNILPLNLKKGDKILILNICKDKNDDNIWFRCNLNTVEAELKSRGFVVKKYVNSKREEFKADIEDADAILINCKISSNDYLGGTLRITSAHIGPVWRGEVLRHKNVIFTSFGDPYKIYDFPYLKTYINTFSANESSQQAFVKAVLGEIPFEGKSPVALKDFFETDVE